MDFSVKRTALRGEIPVLEPWRMEGYRRIEALHAFRRACFSELAGRMARVLGLSAKTFRRNQTKGAGGDCDLTHGARIAIERIEFASRQRKLPLRRYRELWLRLFLDDELVDRTVVPVRLAGGRVLFAGDGGDAVSLSVLRARGVRRVSVAAEEALPAEIRCSVFGGTIPALDVGYHYENENDDCCDDAQGDAKCVHGAGCLL